MEDSFLTHEALELKVLESDIQRISRIWKALEERLNATEDCLLEYQRELNNLACLCLQRYRDGPDEDVLMSYADLAINVLEHGLGRVAADTNQARDVHLALGNAHLEKMLREGKKADAITAEDYFRKVLEYMEGEADKTWKPAIDLSSTIRFQFLWTENLNKLGEALAMVEQHIVKCSVIAEAMPQLLRECGELLLQRADFTGYADDLEIALEVIQTGLNLSSPSSTTASDLSLTQATALRLRFEVYEERSDLLAARNLFNPAMIPPRLFLHERQEFIVRLLDLLCVQHAYDRSLESVNSAKQYLSILLNAHGTQYLSFVCLAIFGYTARVYLRRYLHGLESHDLNMAFMSSRKCCKAVKTWSSDWKSCAVEAEYYTLLGITQGLRYARFRSPKVLDYALSALRRSVRLTNRSSDRLSGRIGLLCNALHRKYTDRAEECSLNEAKHWLDVISESSPMRAVDSARKLSLQAQVEYETHCLAGTKLEGLDIAIKSLQSTQTVTSQKDLYHETVMLLLSLHIHRGKLSRNMEDYAAAEGVFRTICEKADPPETPGGTLWARLQRAQFELSTEPQFGREWLAANRGIIENVGFSAEDKFLATVQNASLELRLNSDRNAVKMWILKGFEFMEEIVFLAHSRQDQLALIRKYGRFPYVVVRFLIGHENLAREAIQVLERGRNLIWNGILNLKMPITDLQERHPELGARFRKIRNQISQKENAHMFFSDIPHDEYHLGLEFQKILVEIRRLDGFKEFLLTPSMALGELCQYAVDGPAVAIVPAEGSLDNGLALIVDNHRPRILHLPLLKEEDCRVMALRFRRAIELQIGVPELPLPAYLATDEAYAVLKWLWDVAGKPILDSLGFYGKADSKVDLPRMWWVTSGWTNVLPIHAAGDFADNSLTNKPQAVADRVLSSYTPTLKALWHAREQTKRLQRSTLMEPRTAMLVAMKTTPSSLGEKVYDPLNNADHEIDVIDSLLKPYVTIRRPNARFEEVIDTLKSCTIAHFACHGDVGDQDPLNSRLLLEDHVERPLSVGAIMQTDFEMCRLAYLSACSTAVSIDRDLQDEALHMCAAFQMAGVPQVVGSWWEVHDEISSLVAGQFYTNLVANEALDINRASVSLHQVIHEMRMQGLSPLIWGAYVQFGA